MPLSNNFYPSPSDADQLAAHFQIPTQRPEAGGSRQPISGSFETAEFESDALSRIRHEIDRMQSAQESSANPDVLRGLAQQTENNGIGVVEMRIDYTHRHILSDDMRQGSLWQ